MSTKRNALGKGLSALLENANTDITSTKLVAITPMAMPRSTRFR